jgi:hypothetical protein
LGERFPLCRQALQPCVRYEATAFFRFDIQLIRNLPIGKRRQSFDFEPITQGESDATLSHIPIITPAPNSRKCKDGEKRRGQNPFYVEAYA